jgi:replicative DNA helicase
VAEAVFTREVPNAAGADAPRLMRLGDLLGEWEADAKAAFDARTKGIARGPVVGLPRLDAELGGVLEPGVHILHGSPGSGKSAFALQAAASCGCACLFLTVEMRPLELLRRLTARVTGTFLGRLKSGELDPATSLAKAKEAARAAPLLTFADGTTAFAPTEWLRRAVEVVRGDGPHVLVVVDSVHAWADSQQSDLDEYTRLGLAIAALRTVARQLGVPVLGVAERNRASMTKGGLSASAGSRKFEFSAESVLDLATDTEKGPDAAGEMAVVLKIAKNRNGSPGRTLNLRFNGALQKFTEA